MTKDEAINTYYNQEIHHGECKKNIGPRGGITITQTRVRVHGKCKVWKTRPSQFKLPYAYGLYQYGYIDECNAEHFHLASKCSLNEAE